MRRFVLVFVAVALACSRETQAPPPVADTVATVSTQPPPATESRMPELQKGTYDEALLWMRSAPRFGFTLQEGSVRAEGEMTRSTVGAERVSFRANGERWEAAAMPQGVVWKRDGKPSDPPPWGVRLYQRVTLAFDPQKKEGVPLLVSSENGMNLYRFTNANTGEVHEVWVRQSDASIARMRVGDSVEMTFAP